MKIAYLVNTYPRPSHTFIRREIAALERLGCDVKRYALRSDRAALRDAADLAEDAQTEHVLSHGLAAILPSALAGLARNPARALAALRLALACGARGAGGVPGGGGRLRHLVYLAEAAHLNRRWKATGITHVHAHFGTNAATVAMLAQALGGPTYSFTTHGPEEFDAPLALSLGEKVARARFAVAISSFGKSQLCRWADPTHWPRLHVVPCGIEPAGFVAADLPEGGPHVVAIGRFTEQKGFPLLIEAMAKAAPVLPGLRLALVGDGPLRPQIEARIAELGLSDRIMLAGWQDDAGVRRHLEAAQALILPSFAEGLPVVLMEAMASGRPVIATAIAGVPELVTPECGWLVPAGDSDALAEAIIALSQTAAAELATMGQTARRRALDRHDVQAAAARIFALFQGKDPDR